MQGKKIVGTRTTTPEILAAPFSLPFQTVTAQCYQYFIADYHLHLACPMESGRKGWRYCQIITKGGICCWWNVIYMSVRMCTWEVTDLAPGSLISMILGTCLPSLDPGPPETLPHPCPSPYYMHLLAVGCLNSCPSDWDHPFLGKAAPVCCAWLSLVDVRQLG